MRIVEAMREVSNIRRQKEEVTRVWSWRHIPLSCSLCRSNPDCRCCRKDSLSFLLPLLLSPSSCLFYFPSGFGIFFPHSLQRQRSSILAPILHHPSSQGTTDPRKTSDKNDVKSTRVKKKLSHRSGPDNQ